MPLDAKAPRAVLAVLPAVVTVLLTAACGSGFIGSPKTPPEEVDRLKRQVVELRQRATVAELEGARLEREIARLEAELEQAERSSESAAREAAAIEPNAPAAIGLDQEIEETDLEEAPIVAAEPIAAVESPAAPALVPTSAEAQALYDEGYTLFHEQRYADAEARFSRFVELYPRTDLADNALFWVGECRYARGDFSAALEAFSSTVERYPDANKVSDALLKAAKCLESLGEGQQARSTYREVVERYPGTAAAAQASERLDESP
jgi:tol-pal system protein YbgF